MPVVDPVKAAMAAARASAASVSNPHSAIRNPQSNEGSSEEEKMRTYDCANPENNPKCKGTTTRKGGLCRSCGKRKGRTAVQPPPPAEVAQSASNSTARLVDSFARRLAREFLAELGRALGGQE
jgi:hypothetical protein